MSDLNKIASCLEKTKSKSLKQSREDLKYFTLKDFKQDCEDAGKLIVEAVAANAIKSIIGKVAHRIVTPDSVTDDTVLVPEIQENDGNEENDRNDEHNIDSVILEESLISQINSLAPHEHQRDDDDI